ncbi:MAG: hypothetical protein JWO98_5070 [Frankiales bacterium]|nr:hypothetical protein [Frankiales bacterium]
MNGQAPASGATLVTLGFLPLSYLILGVGQAVLGRPGFPLSPLVAAVGLAALLTLTGYKERRLKSRDPHWKDHNDGWVRYLQVLTAVTILGPVIVGAVWPLSVLKGLGPWGAAGLSAVPTVALLAVVMVNRYRFLRSHPEECSVSGAPKRPERP